jgi:hypothetical protein
VRALRLAGEQGYRAGQVLAAIVLGYAARKDGRLDDAERHLHEVLDWTPHAEGNPASAVHLPMTLCELGFVAELRGDPATAAKLHREAFDLSQRLAGPRISLLALEGLAGALAIERPDPAARLLGAAAAARVTVGLPPAPAERGDVDRITAAVRTALGDAAFDAAFRAGRALTPTDARSLGEGTN